ncbi:expressed unknown protein [Seminavis robusta]|uniref:Uncharacterized protein n=1 Tax=Seminavis robusta TaxID=568900 RepID=A0A9N8DT18_9STRA|nr:expressed unknown protein [Seminavis robusta]|eukprot:Sro260_g101651.1  (243) ;mRNA; r:67836-68564
MGTSRIVKPYCVAKDNYSTFWSCQEILGHRMDTSDLTTQLRATMVGEMRDVIHRILCTGEIITKHFQALLGMCQYALPVIRSTALLPPLHKSLHQARLQDAGSVQIHQNTVEHNSLHKLLKLINLAAADCQPLVAPCKQVLDLTKFGCPAEQHKFAGDGTSFEIKLDRQRPLMPCLQALMYLMWDGNPGAMWPSPEGVEGGWAGAEAIRLHRGQFLWRHRRRLTWAYCLKFTLVVYVGLGMK